MRVEEALASDDDNDLMSTDDVTTDGVISSVPTSSARYTNGKGPKYHKIICRLDHSDLTGYISHLVVTAGKTIVVRRRIIFLLVLVITYNRLI